MCVLLERELPSGDLAYVTLLTFGRARICVCADCLYFVKANY